MKFKIFTAVLVFVFTFILRAHNYDRDPQIGQLEELAFAWAGINLIYDKVPMSWSTLDYPASALVYKGEMNLAGSEPRFHVSLYKPWLDQPPLYSLISGGAAYLFGANRWEILPTSYIRSPQIFLSFITSVMVFLVAKKVRGFWTAILAVIIYGTAPIFVLSSRLALPENLISLIYMVIIFLLLKFKEKSSLLYIMPLPFLIGIAGLLKATGFLIAPLLIYELILKRKFKNIIYSLAVITLFVLLLIAYGTFYDPELFWKIMQIQSSRPVGFGSLGYILTSPTFDIFLLIDTFYIFCLLSFTYYLFSQRPILDSGSGKGIDFLIFATIYWFIVVMMSGGENDMLGWYRFGFFPLLPIFGAVALKEIITNLTFPKTVLAVSLFLGNRILLVNAFRPNLDPGLFRLIFALTLTPILAFIVLKKTYLRNLGRFVVIAAFIIGVYINILYVYNVYELKCENQSCPLGPSALLSTIHFPLIWRFFILGEPSVH